MAKVVIEEQVIKTDLISGLEFEFKRTASGGTLMHVSGPGCVSGNRDFFFDADGNHEGGGVFLGGKGPLIQGPLAE